MGGDRIRVLVVDDDHEARLLMSTLMARAGYDVHAVGDGRMALTMVHSMPPDLILLDAHLPAMSGFEVCQRIRALPSLATVPIVVLTAFTGEDARRESFRSGATEYIEKPFRNDHLLGVVRKLLRDVESDPPSTR